MLEPNEFTSLLGKRLPQNVIGGRLDTNCVLALLKILPLKMTGELVFINFTV